MTGIEKPHSKKMSPKVVTSIKKAKNISSKKCFTRANVLAKYPYWASILTMTADYKRQATLPKQGSLPPNDKSSKILAENRNPITLVETRLDSKTRSEEKGVEVQSNEPPFNCTAPVLHTMNSATREGLGTVTNQVSMKNTMSCAIDESSTRHIEGSSSESGFTLENVNTTEKARGNQLSTISRSKEKIDLKQLTACFEDLRKSRSNQKEGIETLCQRLGKIKIDIDVMLQSYAEKLTQEDVNRRKNEVIFKKKMALESELHEKREEKMKEFKTESKLIFESILSKEQNKILKVEKNRMEKVVELELQQFHENCSEEALEKLRIRTEEIILENEKVLKEKISKKESNLRQISWLKLQICCNCSKVGKHLKCNKCEAAFYCNRSCQEEDWNEHRLNCQ